MSSSNTMEENTDGLEHRGGGLENHDTTDRQNSNKTMPELTVQLTKLVEDWDKPLSLQELQKLLLGGTNDRERAREIIQKVRVVIDGFDYPYPLFHVFCVNRHVTMELVRWIIKICPEAVRIQDETFGRTPLHWACSNRFMSIELVEFLIDLYPEAQRVLALPKGKGDKFAYTPLAATIRKNTCLTEAQEEMRIDCIKLLLRKDPESVFINSGGSPDSALEGFGTVVHLACQKKHASLDLLKILVEGFPRSLSMKVGDGLIPLHILVAANSRNDSITDMVQFLVQMYPASINEAIDGGGVPVSIACCAKAPLETIKVLRNYRALIPEGDSPLHLYLNDKTCSSPAKLCLDTIRFLARKYPESLELRNSLGWLPLEQAFQQPLEVIKCLLELYPEGVISDRITIMISGIASGGDSDVLEHLLRVYPDSVAARDARSPFQTTLHAACCSSIRSTSDLQRIFDLHPEAIKMTDDRGNTPLHTACWAFGEDRGLAIPFLIAKYRTACTVRNNGGMLPLHLLCLTEYHVSTDFSPQLTIRLMKELLAAYPTAVAEKDNKGSFPLHNACMAGHGVEVIKALVEAYPLSVQVASTTYGLPIRCVLRSNSNVFCDSHRLSVIKFLVDCYPMNIEMTTNDIGLLPINLALSSGRIDVFDFFLDRLYGQKSDSKLVLHAVIKDQKLTDDTKEEIVRRILDDHPYLMSILDEEGASPFHWAVTRNFGIDFIRCLMELNNQALRQPDKSGSLPLHYCVGYGNPTKESAAVTAMLVEIYPESLRVADATGKLPLHRALMRKYPLDTVEDVLLDQYPESIRVADGNGRLPVHIACENGSPVELIEHLVSLHPGSLTIADRAGEFPLHKACRAGHLTLVEWLSDRDGSALRKVNNEGMTPFLITCHSSGKQRDFYDELEELSTIWNILAKNPETVLVPRDEDDQKVLMKTKV